MKKTRKFTVLLLMILTLSLMCECAVSEGVTAAEEKNIQTSEGDSKAPEDERITFHVTIDPGHGGDDSGAGGIDTNEKKLTLKLAKKVKRELLRYENVTVDLTRKKDKYISLKRRSKKAVEQNADLMVSLHFDSYDPLCAYSSGCSAIVKKLGSYRPAMGKEEKKLARSILQELSKLGIKNHGLIRRLSTDGSTYPDGSTADYYGLIRRGTLYKLPTIIVEHGFIDSEHDYYNFFDTDKKLDELAKADARGIARYLRLKNKETGKILKPLKDKGKKLVCHLKEGSYLSVRDKSFNLDKYRKDGGFDVEANETDVDVSEAAPEENTAAEDVKKDEPPKENAEGGTGGNEAQKGLFAWTNRAPEALPGARRKAEQIIGSLTFILLAYYLYLIIQDA